MRDFTLKTYTLYLNAIKKSYSNILRFDEYFITHPKPKSFCLIRHDVDRKPLNALKMAELENSLDIRATYCFRTKEHTFKPDIISSISSMGHEISYHYESLSDMMGNREKAMEDFERNLSMMRNLVSVSTICMHGRPFSAYDNKDIWKTDENHKRLVNQYNILGEIYLDIDYTDIAYINDTGRNWYSNKANRRDHVNSNISVDFSSGRILLEYLSNHPHPKLVFQIHPERWSDINFEYFVQYSKDMVVNFAKNII